MLQKLFRICSLVLVGIAFFSAQKIVASELNPKLSEESSREYFHIVSQEDLFLDDDGIQVNLNGTLYLASSLKRMGNQWLVSVDPRYQCPWGHSLCGHCHMCHKKICSDYIPRCSASK
jgi:hypothetical protein